VSDSGFLKKFFDYATDENRVERIPKMTSFKTKLNNDLVKFAAESFIKNSDKILEGSASPIFDNASNEAKVLDALKKYTRRHLFRSDAAENIELAGYEIIKGILNHFKPLLACSRKAFLAITKYETKAEGLEDTDLHRRLFRRLPDSYFFAYNR